MLSHVNKQLRKLCLTYLKSEYITKFDIYCNAIASCDINYQMMVNIGTPLHIINNIIVRCNNLNVLQDYENKIVNFKLSEDTLHIVISESNLETIEYVFSSQY